MTDERALGRFFDDCAARGIMTEFEAGDEKRIRKLLKRWGIRRGWWILEPGCGAGRLTERLARIVGFRGRVVAFDLSNAMIRRAARRNPPRHVHLLRASVHRLPVRSGTFDVAICFHAFPHFENPSRALAEIARALKPGGFLWIVHLKSRAAVNRIHREGGPEIRSHRLPPARTMKQLLRDAGFRLRGLQDGPGGYSLQAVRERPGFSRRGPSQPGKLSGPHGKRTR